MRECEVKEAVKLAHDYAVFEVQLSPEGFQKVCEALIALDNDDVCEDDDDDEPTFPVTGAFGERYVDEPPHRNAWPPWNPMPLPGRDTCAIHVGHSAAQNYHIGMKLLAGAQKRGLLRGLWRWLTKSNWRVTDIRYGIVTCEKSR